jgi:hypothetical protein
MILLEKYNIINHSRVMRITGAILIIVWIVLGSTSCKKYLDKKQDKSVSTVSKLLELQYALNNYDLLNRSYTAVETVFADEYYVPSSFWSTYGSSEKPLYIWNDIPVRGGGWNFPYQIVFSTNLILESLERFDRNADSYTYDNIKGQALVFRSFAFYHAAQIWCKPYSSSASTDPGIPIRLSSDINVTSNRGTVQETYNQIVKDLKEAIRLLPEESIAVTRPNKSAAYAVLARVCLSKRDYINASLYADSCLQRNYTLMDYNTLNGNQAFPIPASNPEILFLVTVGAGYHLIRPNNHVPVDTNFYKSYADKDLRKTIFYQENGTDHYFKGYYNPLENGNYLFYGFATDEMYLIRAEGSARAGDIDSAIADLNRLMIKRWKNDGSWVPFTGSSAIDVLNKILTERKKELPFRGLRWSDLRRFNVEGADITLTRVLDGITYTLPSNDPRWTYLIPLDVIQLTGMEQNLR